MRKVPDFAGTILRRVMQSKIGAQIVTGAFWSLTGALFSRALMVIATILVARLLGRTVYGEYGIVLSTVNSFIVFAGVGLSVTAAKYIAEFRETDKAKTGRIIGLSYMFTAFSGIVLTLVLLAAAPWLCEDVIKKPHLVNEVRLGLLFLVIAAVNGAQNGVMVGFQAFRAMACANIVIGLLVIPLRAGGAAIGSYIRFMQDGTGSCAGDMVCCAGGTVCCAGGTVNMGLPGAVIGFGLSLIAVLVVNRIVIGRLTARHGIRISYRDALQEVPVLWKFSLPAVASAVLVAPVIWVCYVLLARTPAGAAEVALLDAARQYQMMILFIPGAISQVILPMLVRAGRGRPETEDGRGEESGVRNQEEATNANPEAGRLKPEASRLQTPYLKVLKYNLVLNAGVATLIALPVVALSPWLIRAFGEDFSEGIATLCLLAATAIPIAVNGVVGQVLASRGKMWTAFTFNLFWGIILVFGTIVAMSMGLGAFGIALAMLIAYVCHTLIQFAYLAVVLKKNDF